MRLVISPNFASMLPKKEMARWRLLYLNKFFTFIGPFLLYIHQGRRNRPDQPGRGLAWISKSIDRGYPVIILEALLLANWRTGENQFRLPCTLYMKHQFARLKSWNELVEKSWFPFHEKMWWAQWFDFLLIAIVSWSFQNIFVAKTFKF